MDLTKVFAPERFARGLESWAWIGIDDRVPAFASPFGDVFFRSDDGFWWLDTLDGSLSRPWPDAEAMNADLGTPAGQDQYLLAGLALERGAPRYRANRRPGIRFQGAAGPRWTPRGG